jgi:hypothetical protein
MAAAATATAIAVPIKRPVLKVRGKKLAMNEVSRMKIGGR